jgi:hypothetical protein
MTLPIRGNELVVVVVVKRDLLNIKITTDSTFPGFDPSWA